eukprot:761425-Hanusia_phi.AAC.1
MAEELDEEPGVTGGGAAMCGGAEVQDGAEERGDEGEHTGVPEGEEAVPERELDGLAGREGVPAMDGGVRAAGANELGAAGSAGGAGRSSVRVAGHDGVRGELVS